jgi:type IX secretion system PorP/SprF family membrane protein
MKIYKRAVFIVLLVLPFVGLKAQQEAQFVHNMFNGIFYNPGFAGSIGGISALGLVRQQWVGFKDSDGNNIAPSTYTLSIHSPLNFLHGGVGLNIYNDKLGFQSEIGVKLMYAYRVDIGMGNLGIGTQLDFINSTWDLAKLREGANDENDPVLAGGGEQKDMKFDFGLGVQYLVPDKFYVGASATRILQPKSKNSESDTALYQYKRHYFLSGGYEWSFPNNPSYVIEPSLLIKSDAVKTQFDLAALLKYNNKVWGGVSYSTLRVMDPFSVLLGLSIKDIIIGYAYTIPTSPIGSGGSHEVMVGYNFKINMDKGRRSYRNTRFL